MTSGVIRQAQLSDLAEIEAIESASNPVPWTALALKTSFDSPNQVYVYHQSGKVVAYLIGVVAASEASLLHIVVSKSSQGHGIGTQLLSAWLSDIKTQAAVQVCWLEVRQSNMAAQRLYQNIGFEQVGLRKGYYRQHAKSQTLSQENQREDALIFRLGLSSCVINNEAT